MEAVRDFKVGDYVRVKYEEGTVWKDAKINHRVRVGRGAKVVRIIGTALLPIQREYYIEFPKHGRETAFTAYIPARYLEFAG